MIRSTWLVIILFFLAMPAKAQDLNETLSQVGEAYARAYVNPLADALGANLNTGLFHTAGVSKRVFGVNVYFGLKASAALLDNSHKSFNLVYQGNVPLDVELAGQTISMDVPATFTVDNAPTIFGEDQVGFATVSVNHDTTISTLGLNLPVSFDSTLTPRETIGGLLQTSVAPFVVPQIGLGTVFGTDVMIRWLPQIKVTDVGALELFGFGVRHNLNQYIPALPFDLSIQAAWQSIRAEDDLGAEVLEANTFAVNLALSKRIGVLTVYGGLQTERSDISFSYIFDVDDVDSSIDVDPIDVNFTLSNVGKTRGIFGLGLKLGPVVWNADISVGQITVVSAGFGFAF
ncbi:MAG: DUF6588 family protein [Rhodothermales bacterium]